MRKLPLVVLVLPVLAAAAPVAAHADNFTPGDIVVASTTYANVGQVAGLTVGATNQLPGGGTTVADGSNLGVFFNSSADGNFGVSSAITLSELTPSGGLVGSFSLPSASLNSAAGITTSFSSKSELALNLSQDGHALTLMGYSAPTGYLDASNANTPGVPDSTNSDTAGPVYREIAQIGGDKSVQITQTNSYSGDNGRAAILGKTGLYYSAGNANDATAQEINSTGIQLAKPGSPPAAISTVSGQPNTQAGYFNISTVDNPATGKPYTVDSPGKDNNFRGLTVFDNTLYASKGSGGKGINSIYQVGSAGSLPTAADAPQPISILPGLPTFESKANPGYYPFGIYFANADTLYVGDEGPGTASSDALAGLQKWTKSGGTWHLDYTVQNGLGIGGPGYDVAGFGTVIPEGLRNLTGHVNADGTVTIYAATSTYDNISETVDGNTYTMDAGADPNALVSITDTLGDTSLPSGESFTTLEGPTYGTVYRGVAFAPSVPEPASLAVLGVGLAGLLALRRRGRRTA